MAIGWEGCLANGGPQGPIYGQNRQRTASNRLLESHRKQSSNGLQHRVSHSDGTMVSPRPDPADSSFMTVYNNQRFSTGFDKNMSVVLSNSEEVSEGTLGYIRSQIIDGLPSSHDAYRTILLSVHSDIVGFMTDQFGETINSDTTLGSVITLSSSALYAQAMTCKS